MIACLKCGHGAPHDKFMVSYLFKLGCTVPGCGCDGSDEKCGICGKDAVINLGDGPRCDSHKADGVAGRMVLGGVPVGGPVRDLVSPSGSETLTDKDKAVEYDRIADYLRKNGWSVLKVWRHPVDGTLHESWYRGDPHSQHDLLSAYRAECYKDAPKQGERMRENLEGISRVIDEKHAAAVARRQEVDWTTAPLGPLDDLSIAARQTAVSVAQRERRLWLGVRKGETRPCANCGHTEGAHWYISGGHAGPLEFDGCSSDQEGDPRCDCPEFKPGDHA